MHPCHLEILNELEKSLNSMDIFQSISSRSTSFKKYFKESLRTINNARLGKFNISNKAALHKAGAIFELDGIVSCKSTCAKHKVGFSLCLNNRETIGTNFLKLEVFCNENKSTLGVLIALSRDVLKLGKWDPAYADAAEYSLAFKNAYSSIINSEIVIFQMNAI